MPSQKKTGASTLRGGRKSRQQVAAILEALSGESGVTEASEKLGISLSRYYQLEARALQGMLNALEPRPRGIQKTPEREIKALQAEKRQLTLDLRRHQSLLRAAHRTLGLAKGGRKKASSKVRRGVRGKTVRKTLRREGDEPKGAGDGTAKRDVDTGGPGGSE